MYKRARSGTHMLVAANSCLFGFKAHQQEGNNAWNEKPSQLSGTRDAMDLRRKSTTTTLLD